jgi:hypothetical protein
MMGILNSLGKSQESNRGKSTFLNTLVMTPDDGYHWQNFVKKNGLPKKKFSPGEVSK